jgi:hypothetical protein
MCLTNFDLVFIQGEVYGPSFNLLFCGYLVVITQVSKKTIFF